MEDKHLGHVTHQRQVGVREVQYDLIARDELPVVAADVGVAGAGALVTV